MPYHTHKTTATTVTPKKLIHLPLYAARPSLQKILAVLQPQADNHPASIRAPSGVSRLLKAPIKVGSTAGILTGHHADVAVCLVKLPGLLREGFVHITVFLNKLRQPVVLLPVCINCILHHLRLVGVEPGLDGFCSALDNPLHDGAVVIRDNKIAAAACMLPLASDTDIAKELGTRHRAAIGISKESDAIAVVVSEETGKVSVAKDGTLIADVREDVLKKILISNIVTKRFNEKDNVINERFSKIKSIFEKKEKKVNSVSSDK